MLKKTIKYTDFNGEEVTETFYFNMTRAELVELEFSMEGGFSETMTRMIETDPEGKVNGKVIMQEMKKLILGSYGVKSADGRKFVKNDELRQDFESSEAYSALFMECVTDAGKAAEFINGIIPANLAEEVAKMSDEDKARIQNVKAVPDPEPRVITRAELLDMNGADLAAAQAEIAAGSARLAE
jgi:hypothetical protein